jgi:predicted DNA repair protein MutK
MDDVGAYLLSKSSVLAKSVGKVLLLAAPKLMKALTVIGTAAMFMVGGGILAHGVPPVQHGIEQLAEQIGVFGGALSLLLDVLVGLIGGALALGLVTLISRLKSKKEVA